MKMTSIPFKLNRYRNQPMVCGIWGCQRQAEHVTSFMYRDAEIKVLLCDDCANKSPEFILKGLRAQPDTPKGGSSCYHECFFCSR